jgi:type II secretory pathway component PulK
MKRLQRRRGVALMLVLWLVVVLGVIGAGVVRGTRATSAIAANVRAQLVARLSAESGIEALVAAIEDTLASLSDSASRQDWLNGLEDGASRGDTTVLGEGRFAVTVVDVSARLDVNAAPEPALRAFFARFTDLAGAADIARAIRRQIERAGPAAGGDQRLEADPFGTLRPVRPLRSLEELSRRRLVPERILERAAPYLTVDGDGSVNRSAASDTVLVAAAGELRDEPSRFLIIARGWMGGHPLTHEVQAVYAITGDRLVLAHRRERDR